MMTPMATEITPTLIAEAATDPQTVSVDGTQVTDRSIADKITADQYAKTATALDGANSGGSNRSGWGGRMTRPGRVVPPGAT